ncbi:DUF418 domain-containing protein [Lysobacter sp. CFH 32150]|uniref:DUF418 domain-containing protein n=1 Tax=Lysobacter sp. CFH 32150 TaxID=2927128 RepID=UPI001FA71C58|nr:DUF418 domain-containing protein [Lysobacter sp. CFH 32150]MCI4569383.1 DUF418 domain-containing protein [Lysobacter sp. CFH 32150]
MNASMSDTGLKPVASNERIVTLDVIRGFALLGIFLMNIEWFNRPLSDLDAGLPAGVSGIDYWAGWFVHVFVRGKFWTMFSLLFGMGFAVMLTRAEHAGRGFFGPYLRRTLALAVIGALHFIFIWMGDILFSYATGAALLMVVFYTRPRILFILAGTLGLLAGAFGLAEFLGHELAPWGPFLGFGIALLVLACVAAALRRWPVSGMRGAGLALYLLPFLAMTIGGAVMTVTPPQAREQAAEQAAKTPEQKKELAEQKEKKLERRKEHAQDIADETRLMSRGTYAEAVAWRAEQFVKHQGQTVGFAVIVLGMFLLGAWFIRSGVMTNPAAHLDLFRKLAWFGIPLGLGMSLISASIAVTHVRDQNDGPYQLAMGLAMLGNLPACLGYISAVVLMFHGRLRRWVAPLAPAGRMALTNYLGTSVICTLVFYGYGLGYWGLARAWQIPFVFAVFGVQVLLSRWWLARFRYGPMEWLWRSVTYLQIPRMRHLEAQAA